MWTVEATGRPGSLVPATLAGGSPKAGEPDLAQLFVRWDGEFESGFLHRGVCCEPDILARAACWSWARVAKSGIATAPVWIVGLRGTGGPLTGAAFNPARALGPMIVTGNLGDAWLYGLAQECMSRADGGHAQYTRSSRATCGIVY
jgi:hypothetical protein